MGYSVLREQNGMPEFLIGGGEIGQRIKDFNWSETSIGPLHLWPQSLRSALGICINSNFPIAIYWGIELILIYNQAWSSIPGNKHPWAIGKPAKEVWPEIWNDIEPLFQEAFRNGKATGSKDGLLPMERHGYLEECYFDFTFTPIFGETGKVEGIFNAVIETTYRVINERRNLVLQNLTVSIGNLTESLEVLEMSTKVLKTARQDVAFFEVYNFTSNNKLALFSSSHQNNTTINEWPFSRVSSIAYLLIEDLSEFFLEMPVGYWPESPSQAIIIPMRGNDGAVTGYIVFGISARRKFDKEYLLFFENITNAISGVVNTIKSLQEEKKRAEALEQIDRAKTTFFSNISHEFRTPLTLLLGPIEDLLNDSTINDDCREKVGVAFRNAQRMQKLVNLLLEFSRIEAGRIEANFVAVDIVSLTEDLVSNFRSAIEKAGMDLIVESDTIDETVFVDVDMWEKIILNLLSNAFKYSEKGSITVSVTKKKSDIEVSVKDTGVGIPEHELENIFERFHRVQNVRGRSQEGTGIGLAMVKELVKLHNGRISVTSKLDEGSNFTVTIPIRNNQAEIENEVQQKPVRAVLSNASMYVEEALQWLPESEANIISEKNAILTERKHKVLLADDNADMRKYVYRLLNTDYHVIVVHDGEEAYAKALEHLPDLILSDIMMPKLDGFGLLKKLKSNLTTRNIPLIFLSARAGEEAKVEGITAGADDYLTKPFSSRELLARIDNHIAISSARRQAEKEFYNLFLQSPAHIHVMKGPEHTFEFFHPLGIPFAGKDATGMKVREALPYLEGQEFFQMLDRVYNEGITIHAENSKATFTNEKGESRDHYFDITYLPWKDIEGKIQGVLQFTFEVTETVKLRMLAEANEKKFRSIAQQAPIAMAVLKGPAHIVEVANNRVLEMWDRTYDEVINRPILSIFPELVSQGFKELLSNVFETGQPFAVNEMPITFMRDGKSADVLVNLLYEPFRNENNEIEGIVAVGTDVTEQVVARRKIAEDGERLRIATEVLALGTWEFDPLQDLVYCSDKTIEIFGFINDKVIHINDVLSAIVDDDRQRVAEAIQWALTFESEGKYDIEYALQNADKRIRIVRANGQVFFDSQNKPYRFIGTVLDVTERRKAEQEIKASEARFRLLSTSIPQIVWTTDRDGNTNYINAQFVKFTGQKIEHSYDTWQNLIHPDDKERVLSKRALAMKNSSAWQEEFRLKNVNTGNYRWFMGNAQPLEDANGNIMMWVGSASDIQDLKEQANLLEQQVAERTKSLKELNQSLKLSNEDLQQFAHVASHDLKEPIRKIKTYSHRIQDDFKEFLPDRGKVFLTKILNATDRMYSMIDGVLSYSTIDSVDQAIENVNLNEVIKNIMADLELLIQEKQSTIIYYNLPHVEGAPVLIYQLFYNLINNSIKFSKIDVPAIITIESSKEKIEDNMYDKVILSDNGIGFSQDQAERIFTTFTRLNPKDKYEGTGLGLALCKKIVHRHGGFISAKGEKNIGASFVILLPTNQI